MVTWPIALTEGLIGTYRLKTPFQLHFIRLTEHVWPDLKPHCCWKSLQSTGRFPAASKKKGESSWPGVCVVFEQKQIKKRKHSSCVLRWTRSGCLLMPQGQLTMFLWLLEKLLMTKPVTVNAEKFLKRSHKKLNRLHAMAAGADMTSIGLLL